MLCGCGPAGLGCARRGWALRLAQDLCTRCWIFAEDQVPGLFRHPIHVQEDLQCGCRKTLGRKFLAPRCGGSRGATDVPPSHRALPESGSSRTQLDLRAGREQLGGAPRRVRVVSDVEVALSSEPSTFGSAYRPAGGCRRFLYRRPWKRCDFPAHPPGCLVRKKPSPRSRIRPRDVSADQLGLLPGHRTGHPHLDRGKCGVAGNCETAA
mmetsp:Transcript_50864/g.110905  ORF Transcript_50864/g.110905 Transcript_50864/m.110905 type:complete len:209 (-) Transcript_50864:60-686(-)